MTVEALRPARLDRRWAVLLTILVVFAALGNANSLRGARDTHRAFSREVSAQFAALEALGRANVPADLVAGTYLAPGITAEDYFAMTDDLGSPVDVTQDVVERGEKERRDADIVLATALRGLQPRPVTIESMAPAPTVDGPTPGTATREGPCVRFVPRRPGAAAIVSTDRSVVIAAPRTGSVDVSLRRFADRFRRIARLPPEASIGLPLLDGGIATPWVLHVASRGSVRICTARVRQPT
jgi:hypothetical protein